MKKIFKCAAAFVAAAALILPFTAHAALSIGELLHDSVIDIARETTLTDSALWNGNGRQQEYFLTVKPNATAMPKVVYGNKLYGMSDINYIQDFMDKNGYKGVAGINADFFSTATGLPLGMVVTDGILRSSDAGQRAVGFDQEGNAFIGNPGLYLKAKIGEETILIDHFNKLRQPYAVYMMTSDFGNDTKNKTDGIDVVLRIQEGSFSIGGTVKAVVESKDQYKGAIKIEDDMIVVTCDMGGPIERLAAFEPGVEVEFQVSPTDERFIGCENAVGGGEKLLTNGEIESGLPAGTAPRTALGIKADGSIVMYVNDGRQTGYSVGLSLKDVAQRLKDLGCVEAINFDGGGSTAISTDYPGTGNLKIINRPSDGQPRKCANYLFLVNTTEPTSSADKLFLYPYDVLTLPGGKTSFTPKATDTNYHATAVPETLSYAVTDGTPGSVSPDGTFVASGLGSGRVTVTSETGAAGYATVNVVSPDEMYIKNEKTGKEVTTLSPALGQTIDLTAEAYYKTYTLEAEDTAFEWSVTGNAGSITQDGVFTASTMLGASGSIVVRSGEMVKEIPVKFALEPKTLETFEESNYGETAMAGNMQVSEEANTDFVKYGRRSLKMYYQIPAAAIGENGGVDLHLATDNSPKYLSFYLYGNGSNTQLKLVTKQGEEQTTVVDAGPIGFWGYRQLLVELPDWTTEIVGFRIENPGEQTAYGTVYLDQIQALYSDLTDTTPPEVTLDPLSPILGAETIAVTGTVKDSFEKLEKQNIALTLDGEPCEFDYDPVTGALVASVPAPRDLNMHRITVEATDSSGNIGSSSQNYNEGADSMTSFVDTADHWSAAYAEYLFDQGILGGEMIENHRYFYPQKNLSRAEFAKIISNYLGIDTTQYESVQLPYVDIETIPEWALPYVRAVYARGIILGKDMGDGISFDPLGNVTRAEMMTILGRTQRRGYAEADLNFTDTATIPDYAYSYAGALVSRGILGGYDDNTIRPFQPVTRGEMAKMLTLLF